MARSNLHDPSPLPMFKPWDRKRHTSCIDPPPPWDVPPDPHVADPSTTLDAGFKHMRMEFMAHVRDVAGLFNRTSPLQPDHTDDDGLPKPDPQPHPPRPSSPVVLRRPRTVINRPRRNPSPSSLPTPPPPPPPPPPSTTRSLRLRSAASAEKSQTRPCRFSVSLTREEIEEDFFAITGRRAPGRPKRRPRDVRRQLELLSPGLGLSEVTPALYDVPAPRGGG